MSDKSYAVEARLNALMANQPSILVPSGALTITSTSTWTQVVPTYTFSGANTYLVEGQAVYAGSGSLKLQFQGSATLNCRIIFLEYAYTTGGGTGAELTGYGQDVNGLATTFGGAALGAAERVCTFYGTAVVTGPGSFGLWAEQGTAADSYTIYAYGTYMRISPQF